MFISQIKHFQLLHGLRHIENRSRTKIVLCHARSCFVTNSSRIYKKITKSMIYDKLLEIR